MPLREVIACHCRQCRKTSGHYWAASSVPMNRFHLIRDQSLVWFRSSLLARRGHCGTCGASLLWKPDAEDSISFAAGALDGATGLALGRHIFVDDRGDYYTPEGPPPPASPAPARLSASCLCGRVAFTVAPDKGGVGACHCRQCRKLSGHFSASFDADEAKVVYAARDSLAEYQTSGGSRRGFCRTCGSSLWFRAAPGGFSVEAGSVDGATGLRLQSHIFVAEKGDYYRIDDGLPQYPGWD